MFQRMFAVQQAAQVSVEIGKLFNKNFLSSPRHTRVNMNVIFHHMTHEEALIHEYALIRV